MPNGRRISESNVKYFLRLAGIYHRKMGLPLDGREDRIQTAVAAVLRLARRYDGPAPFMAVAKIRLRYELIEFIKTWKRQMKRKFTHLPASVYDSSIRETLDGRDWFKDVDTKEFIETMLSRLSHPQYRRVLRSLATGANLKQAARAAGLSEASVSLLVRKRFRNLAKKLAGERMVLA